MSTHEHLRSEGEVKVESVVNLPYAGEGCDEHYEVREVVEDKQYAIKKTSLNKQNPYLQAMLIGEILAEPRSKKPFWKK